MKVMKKLLMLISFGIFGLLSASSQVTMTFHILKIKKIKNDCYKLTAESNGVKYTIYSHDDADKHKEEKIRCHENIELTIIPFFKTGHMSLAEFKNEMGMKVNSEDSTRFVDVTLPLNYQSITTNYYGNKIKIKKKMLYYTSEEHSNGNKR